MSHDLLDVIKPQIEAMNEMYAVGYKAGLAEGKRQVWAEIKKDLDKSPTPPPTAR